MNFLSINQTYKPQFSQPNSQLKFKANKFYTLEEVNKASTVSPKEVKEGVEKLTKKIRFLNGILKENDTFLGSPAKDLYLPNVAEDPKNGSWDNFLGSKWNKIHYNTSMPK